jgi:hypothetical protein
MPRQVGEHLGRDTFFERQVILRRLDFGSSSVPFLSDVDAIDREP